MSVHGFEFLGAGYDGFGGDFLEGARLEVFSVNIDRELGGGGGVDVADGGGHFRWIGASGGDVFRVLEVGVPELSGEGGFPLVDEALLLDAGDVLAEDSQGFAQHPFRVEVCIGFLEEPAVDGEIRRVAFLGEDFVEVLIDRAFEKDGVNGHGFWTVDAPDPVDELLVLIVSVRESRQDEVRAILKAVTLAHGFEARDEDGVRALLELIGQQAALLGRGVAIEEHAGDLGLGELGGQVAAEVAEGRADDHLLAVGEALADDLQTVTASASFSEAGHRAARRRLVSCMPTCVRRCTGLEPGFLPQSGACWRWYW